MSSSSKIRRDTRFFISAVTRELGSVRKLAKKGLEDNDYHVVEQDNFPPDYRKLVDKLRERIASCDAVLHIAGHCFGAEPQQRPVGAPRRSYTQLEYDLAVELGKPVYVFLTAADFPTDPHEPEDEERVRLQAVHRQNLIGTGQDYSCTATREELDQKIRSLQLKFEHIEEELARVDENVVATGRRLSHRIVVGTAAVIVLLGGIGLFMAQEHRQAVKAIPEVVAKATGEQVDQARKKTLVEFQNLYTDPDVLTGTLKSRIRKRADEEISKARKDKADWRKIDDIEKRRDQALGRVEDLVATIRDGLKGDADPVFVEAARLLAEKGIKESIEYLESKRSQILDKIKRILNRQDQDEAEKRELLRPILLDANLLEVDTQWEKAEETYKLIVATAPLWFEAPKSLGRLYRTLARYEEAQLPLLEAMRLARGEQVSIAMTDLALLYQDTGQLEEAERLMRAVVALDSKEGVERTEEAAIHLSNLGWLLKVKNRFDESEQLLRAATVIVEKRGRTPAPLYAGMIMNLASLLEATGRLVEAEVLIRQALAIIESDDPQDDGRIATFTANLGLLAQKTGRLSSAEPLLYRSLLLDKRRYGIDHPKCATRLLNLASLYADTGRRPLAEQLHRIALSIDEAATDPTHNSVARDCTSLGQLLYQTGRIEEASPLLLRSLWINERTFDLVHSSVGTDLSGIGVILKSKGQLGDALLISYRAFQIDRHVFDDAHSKVAIRLNNLAQLLQLKGESELAEPLYRIAFLIDEKAYGPSHITVAKRLSNLGDLLRDTGRNEIASTLQSRSLTIYGQAERATGREFDDTKVVSEQFRKTLQSLKLDDEQIDLRVRDAKLGETRLSPFAQELDRVLGVTPTLSTVLTNIEAVYHLSKEPVTHIDHPVADLVATMLRPSMKSMTELAGRAKDSGNNVDAAVYSERVLAMLSDSEKMAASGSVVRLNHASALLDLGDLGESEMELRELASEMNREDSIENRLYARVHYHIARCLFRSGRSVEAISEAEASIAAYDDKPASKDWKNQSLKLLQAMKTTTPNPVDFEEKMKNLARLESARSRFDAWDQLVNLPPVQPATALLDLVLSPIPPAEQVFEELDRKYREQKKPPVWFLPLSEPISTHLDELLGPVPALSDPAQVKDQPPSPSTSPSPAR